MSVSWVGVVGIVTVGFDVVGRDRDISGDLSGSSRLGYHYAYLTLLTYWPLRDVTAQNPVPT